MNEIKMRKENSDDGTRTRFHKHAQYKVGCHHAGPKKKTAHTKNSQATVNATKLSLKGPKFAAYFLFYFKSCLMSIYNLSVMTDPPE